MLWHQFLLRVLNCLWGIFYHDVYHKIRGCLTHCMFLVYIICWQNISYGSHLYESVFMLHAAPITKTLYLHQTITAAQTAPVWYASASSHFLSRMSPFFHWTYKKHSNTIDCLRWDMYNPPAHHCSPLLPTQLHRCFLVCWRCLQMMMLFPNKAHITHFASAKNWVQEAGIPLGYQKWPKEGVSA